MAGEQLRHINLSDLRYDYDPELLGNYGYGGYNNMMLAIEKSLPEIPKEFTICCAKLLPRLTAIYASIEEEGLKNPLIVKYHPEKSLYRVRIGNQRLACLRALGYESVTCLVTSEEPKQFKSLYETVEGCEE